MYVFLWRLAVSNTATPTLEAIKMFLRFCSSEFLRFYTVCCCCCVVVSAVVVVAEIHLPSASVVQWREQDRCLCSLFQFAYAWACNFTTSVQAQKYFDRLRETLPHPPSERNVLCHAHQTHAYPPLPAKFWVQSRSARVAQSLSSKQDYYFTRGCHYFTQGERKTRSKYVISCFICICTCQSYFRGRLVNTRSRDQP